MKCLNPEIFLKSYRSLLIRTHVCNMGSTFITTKRKWWGLRMLSQAAWLNKHSSNLYISYIKEPMAGLCISLSPFVMQSSNHSTSPPMVQDSHLRSFSNHRLHPVQCRCWSRNFQPNEQNSSAAFHAFMIDCLNVATDKSVPWSSHFGIASLWSSTKTSWLDRALQLDSETSAHDLRDAAVVYNSWLTTTEPLIPAQGLIPFNAAIGEDFDVMITTRRINWGSST